MFVAIATWYSDALGDKEIKWFGKPCETSEQQWASPYTVYTSGCFAKKFEGYYEDFVWPLGVQFH
jgi:hypothetical protein